MSKGGCSVWRMLGPDTADLCAVGPDTADLCAVVPDTADLCAVGPDTALPQAASTPWVTGFSSEIV